MRRRGLPATADEDVARKNSHDVSHLAGDVRCSASAADSFMSVILTVRWFSSALPYGVYGDADDYHDEDGMAATRAEHIVTIAGTDTI